MRRFAVAALFFVVAILMPIFIWVAFAFAMREPLLRAGRQLLPWWREGRAAQKLAPVKQRRFGRLLKVAIPVVLMLVSDLEAVFFALSAPYRRWRGQRSLSTVVRRIDSGCLPGYIRVAGRWMPQY